MDEKRLKCSNTDGKLCYDLIMPELILKVTV